MNFLQSIKNFACDEQGATAIEYALIAGLISIAIITAATALGGQIGTVFDTIKTALVAIK